MTKRAWFVVAAAILILSAAGGGVTAFIIAALVLGIPYWIGLIFHPRTRHGSCNGSGEHRSLLYPWAFRKCRGCSGGRQVRHGARVLGSETVRREHRSGVAARRTARERGTWR